MNMNKTIMNYGYMTVMLLLAVLSFIFGTPMAMADVTVPTPGSDDDPNKGTPMEGAVKTAPLDKGGVFQPGQGASASELDAQGMLDKKLQEKVLEYHASQYPFLTKFLTNAQFIDVKGKKEVKYPVIGDPVLEALTSAAISNSSAKAERVSLPLHELDRNIFPTSYTCFVFGMTGYDEEGTPDGSQLMLYVTKNEDGENPVVMAINGPINTATKKTYVPDIPAGTKIVRGASALAEEEVEVTPNNVSPEWEDAYLQKKSYSVSVSEFFEEADKEVDWSTIQIRKQALDIYKRDYTNTLLFGAKRKWVKSTRRGLRNCYSQEGVIHQIRNGYQTTGKLKYQDLINIAELAFLDYTESEEMDLYCGPGFISMVLNIDFENRRPIVYANDKDLKVDIASFTCSFGKLNFIYERAFRYVHLNDCAIGIQMTGAKRVCREKGRTIERDATKQGAIVEEAKDWFFVQDDCCIIDTLNSIIVGPSSVFTNNKYADGVVNMFKSVEALPLKGALGDLVSLTQAVGDNRAGFYKCTKASVGETPTTPAEWSLWNGEFEIG